MSNFLSKGPLGRLCSRVYARRYEICEGEFWCCVTSPLCDKVVAVCDMWRAGLFLHVQICKTIGTVVVFFFTLWHQQTVLCGVLQQNLWAEWVSTQWAACFCFGTSPACCTQNIRW